jgi:hypothetical protein
MERGRRIAVELAAMDSPLRGPQDHAPGLDPRESRKTLRGPQSKPLKKAFPSLLISWRRRAAAGAFCEFKMWPENTDTRLPAAGHRLGAGRDQSSG